MRTTTERNEAAASNKSASIPRALPVFEGYTVDQRLGEFRKVSRETGMEFIPFDSEEGAALWRRWQASLGNVE